MVIIGPVAVGKSTRGAWLAALLDVPFIDLDDVASDYYAEDEQWCAEIASSLDDAFLVLLLPEHDVEASVTVLRRRCVEERGEDQDWLFDEVDFIRDWVVSSQNQSLADTVVYTDGRPVEAIALDSSERVQQ